MGFLTQIEMEKIGFRSLGRNVKISSLASFDKANLTSIGDNSRIDDFCALSGVIEIGRNVHIAVHNSITASEEKITLSDFSGLAFGCRLFSSSDDYSGESLTNPTVPSVYKKILHGAVHLGRHVILGTNTIVFPGVSVAEGCATGANTTLTKSTDPWGIYLGSPGRRVKERRKDLLALEVEYLQSEQNFKE